MELGDVGGAYNERSREYVELFGSPDKVADVDRAVVCRWRDSTTGRLLDAGCGPGQWLGILDDGSRDLLGIDLSQRFLAIARDSYPTVPFLLASLTALPLQTGTVGGVLAWYSIIHTPPTELPTLLSELARVLRSDGSLLLGFFNGEPGHSFPHAVITAYYWSVDALRPLLAQAGLEVVEHHRRQDPGHRPLASLIARPTASGVSDVR